MDIALRQRAFALLREALERDEASRDAFVEESCGSDAALASFVPAKAGISS